MCAKCNPSTLVKVSYLPDFPTMRQGWRCPVCGRGLAPTVAECPCYSNRPKEYTGDTSKITIRPARITDQSPFRDLSTSTISSGSFDDDFDYTIIY